MDDTKLDLTQFLNDNLILICVVAAIILLLIIILCIVLKKKSKKKIKKINITEDFINTLYIGLGGKENIKEILVDNGRLKFNVINLKLLEKESLDKVSQSGVFITGTFVKILFKYDAKDIKSALERK